MSEVSVPVFVPVNDSICCCCCCCFYCLVRRSASPENGTADQLCLEFAASVTAAAAAGVTTLKPVAWSSSSSFSTAAVRVSQLAVCLPGVVCPSVGLCCRARCGFLGSLGHKSTVV